MHSFYIEAPVDGSAALPPGEAKHALKVLRLGVGDEVCAMDGAGRRWRGEIAAVSGNAVMDLVRNTKGHFPVFSNFLSNSSSNILSKDAAL